MTNYYVHVADSVNIIVRLRAYIVACILAKSILSCKFVVICSTNTQQFWQQKLHCASLRNALAN